MPGFTCFTKSGSQYTVRTSEYDDRFATFSGGKFDNIDIIKPQGVFNGLPLEVQCADTPRNASLGLNSKNIIRTSPVDKIYQLRDEVQKDDVGFERD